MERMSFKQFVASDRHRLSHRARLFANVLDASSIEPGTKADVVNVARSARPRDVLNASFGACELWDAYRSQIASIA